MLDERAEQTYFHDFYGLFVRVSGNGLMKLDTLGAASFFAHGCSVTGLDLGGVSSHIVDAPRSREIEVDGFETTATPFRKISEMVKRAALLLLFLFLPAPLLFAQVPARELPRTTGSISIDGELDDAGWTGALVIDEFYETSPGNNTPPKVRTVAWVAYDAKYFYVGIRCDDPEPSRIRAPYVDRDQVFGTDDNVAVFLDTRNDRKSALEFRVNPRGIQGDGIFNEANGSEDFSPDFYYDTAARVTAQGWTAEMRIPFSSLRYPEADPQTWGIRIWRNYPRDFRYAIHSSPTPRETNCFICLLHPISGLKDLPRGGHLVAAPYATAQQDSHPRDEPGSSFTSDPARSDVGIDVKWNPNADITIDGTLNPDFSQIESDVAEITVNQRFAIFSPEKRPFFLEGIDLFSTPIQAVYTRTITSPRWGLRGTGKIGSSAYTLLVSQDRGGGLVILPGTTSSNFAPQDSRTTVAIGRIRHDLGRSFAGLVFTDRELDGGGHNRVIGPDFQWRPSDNDSITGQFLYSSTENPDRPDLSGAFDGRNFSSHGAVLNWGHQSRRIDWFLEAEDFGDGFRADSGFVPQVGYREGSANVGLRLFPETKLISFVRPSLSAEYQTDRDGEKIFQTVSPGVFFFGTHNLNGGFSVSIQEQISVAGRLLEQTYLRYFLQIDPSRRFPRISINGRTGEAIDFANRRVGEGTTVGLNATLRPTDRLELLLNTTRQWLDVDERQGSGRLFTADVQRLKATYSFSAKSLLRVIGQHVKVESDPDLYNFDIDRIRGGFLGSVLYSYKLNWQTVLFLGYGDNEVLNEEENLLPTDRTFFVKVAYAFRR